MHGSHKWAGTKASYTEMDGKTDSKKGYSGILGKLLKKVHEMEQNQNRI